jgi:hypothetical protein
LSGAERGTIRSVSADFEFSADPRYRRLLWLFGATGRTARIRVTDDTFSAWFGPCRVRTPLANIASVELTGPFQARRAIGLRMGRDRGLTMGSTPERGLCIRFHQPVRALPLPGVVKHPALTVTPADPLGLGAALNQHLAETPP